MRQVFPDVLEKGRELTGGYRSARGDRFGRFVLKAPVWTPQSPMLLVIVASAGDPKQWAEDGIPGEPWEHASVSTHCQSPGQREYHAYTPTWVEMCYAKDLFWDPEECVVQFHPPKSQYVNNHPHTLHLWKPTAFELVLPPKVCV